MSVDFSLNSNSQIGWLLILRCALCWVADAVARPTPPTTSDFKPRILNTTLHATFEIRIIARAHRLQIFHTWKVKRHCWPDGASPCATPCLRKPHGAKADRLWEGRRTAARAGRRRVWHRCWKAKRLWTKMTCTSSGWWTQNRRS